ncbi:MAG: phosphoglycerate mutase family protein [Pseudoxanthomonas sp.]
MTSTESSFAAPSRMLACLLLCALAACSANTARKDIGDTTTFVIVRHAEKASDDARDPSLSDTGKTRARNLAHLVADTPLIAAYATGFRRTQQTAQPAADAHGIKITIYDAKISATALASQLRAARGHGTVLVVGHSNTVPDIVAALSGQPVEAMSDDQYDLVYRVRTGSDGKTTLTRDHY